MRLLRILSLLLFFNTTNALASESGSNGMVATVAAGSLGIASGVSLAGVANPNTRIILYLAGITLPVYSLFSIHWVARMRLSSNTRSFTDNLFGKVTSFVGHGLSDNVGKGTLFVECVCMFLLSFGGIGAEFL